MHNWYVRAAFERTRTPRSRDHRARGRGHRGARRRPARRHRAVAGQRHRAPADGRNCATSALVGAAGRRGHRAARHAARPAPAGRAPRCPRTARTAGEQRRYTPQAVPGDVGGGAGPQADVRPGARRSRLGCIGITANNLGGGTPPLDEVYSTFAAAQAAMDANNSGIHRDDPKPWVMFGMHFWSNQDPDDGQARQSPDHTAFLPDASGKVDMTSYKYRDAPGLHELRLRVLGRGQQLALARQPLRGGPGRPDEGATRAPGPSSPMSSRRRPARPASATRTSIARSSASPRRRTTTRRRSHKPNLTSPRFMGAERQARPDHRARLPAARPRSRRGSPPGAVQAPAAGAPPTSGSTTSATSARPRTASTASTATRPPTRSSSSRSTRTSARRRSGSAGRGVIFRLDDLFPP